MDYLINKSSLGFSLENGNTVYLAIGYLVSLDSKGRITDIGISITVNKEKYHSSLLPLIHQMVKDANEEIIGLNRIYGGRKLDVFNSRAE